jgi:hypothetical protein
MPGKLAQLYKCFGDACCLCFQGSRRRLTMPSLAPTHARTLPIHPRHSSHIVSSTIRTQSPLFCLACVIHPHPRELKLPSLPLAIAYPGLAPYNTSSWTAFKNETARSPKMLSHGVISLKTGTFFTLVLGSHSPVLVPSSSSLLCKVKTSWYGGSGYRR